MSNSMSLPVNINTDDLSIGGLPGEGSEGRGLEQIGISKSAIGNSKGLKRYILAMIVDERYEMAEKELLAYLDSKPYFPRFKSRAQRYVEYCIDLINAIRAKRSFPGLSLLRQAKKQEFADRVKEHFEEIKAILQKIERIEVDLKVEDVRSTTWVLRTLSYCMFAIGGLFILLDVIHDGIIQTFLYLVSHSLDEFTDFFVSMIF